jgi:hypothetical protein
MNVSLPDEEEGGNSRISTFIKMHNHERIVAFSRK